MEGAKLWGACAACSAGSLVALSSSTRREHVMMVVLRDMQNTFFMKRVLTGRGMRAVIRLRTCGLRTFVVANSGRCAFFVSS